MRRGLKLGIGIPVAIVGALLTLTGLIMLTVIGFDGTVTTPRTTASTDTHAIVISAGFLDEDLAAIDEGENTLTLEVEGSGSQLFVGVADAADVAAYLEGVPVAEGLELSYPGSSLIVRETGGRVEPTPPAEETFWTESVVGDGTITWELDEGSWSLVVMNADGTAGVEAIGTATVRIPLLGTAVAVILLIGVPLAIVGVVLIVSALRNKADERSSARPGSAPPPAAPGPADHGSVPRRPDLPGS